MKSLKIALMALTLATPITLTSNTAAYAGSPAVATTDGSDKFVLGAVLITLLILMFGRDGGSLGANNSAGSAG